MAIVVSPGPDVVPTPIANVEHDGLGILDTLKGVAHFAVPRFGVNGEIQTCLRRGRNEARSVAVVVFPKVNVPGGEQLGILDLMVLGTRVAGACHFTSATVKAKLQSQVMDLVGHGADAIGPFVWIRHKIARLVSFFGRPAIIDVDVSISEVFQAQFNKLIGGI